MLNAIAVGSMVASLLAPISTPAVTAVDGVSVKVVTVNGSGCPAGEGSAVVSNGGTTVEVTSPTYFALAGGEAAATDFRKNCQINLKVTGPKGLTYAVYEVGSSGFAYLSRGATAVSKVSLYYTGSSQTVPFTSTFQGPMADVWETTDSADVASLEFAPCDTERNLNMNTELRASLGTADAKTTNFVVRDATTTLRLFWIRCS